jgi:hypothetical protein
MYILLVLLIVAVILWLVLKPRWAPDPPDTTALKGKASQASKQASAKAEQMYQGVRGRLKFRNDTRDLAKQFKQWVSETAPASRTELYDTLPGSAEGFALWVSKLSDKDLKRFTQKVARFCASLNFNLAWLTDAQVSHEPELKKAVEDAVLLYGLTLWRANNVQQDVKGFLAYRAWLAKPKRHKAFGQQLYATLAQQGAVSVSPELYLAPEKERLAQAATAIRKVADENHAAFQVALRQVVSTGKDAAIDGLAASQPAAPAAAPLPRNGDLQGAAA